MKPKVGDLSIPAVDAARGAHSGLAATGVLEQLPYFPAATRGALRQLALRCMSDEGKASYQFAASRSALSCAVNLNCVSLISLTDLCNSILLSAPQLYATVLGQLSGGKLVPSSPVYKVF